MERARANDGRREAVKAGRRAEEFLVWKSRGKVQAQSSSQPHVFNGQRFWSSRTSDEGIQIYGSAEAQEFKTEVADWSQVLPSKLLTLKSNSKGVGAGISRERCFSKTDWRPRESDLALDWIVLRIEVHQKLCDKQGQDLESPVWKPEAVKESIAQFKNDWGKEWGREESESV